MEELAEASIEDTDGAGLQPAIALRRPRGQVRQERTPCYYRGLKYTRAWASSRKIAYRCSRFRTGCRATMEFTIATMGYSACALTPVVLLFLLSVGFKTSPRQ
ncbi:hypothetical protein GQ600_19694 [Phytophthora cactorum]|nr:hypothetical protein GQ600_19694 [Phytophthora cactorum]